MAKSRGNLLLHGLSGMLGGQLVVRTFKTGQIVVSARPARDPARRPTAGQQAHRDRFREATRYAKAAQHRPVYQALAAARGVTAYNVALGDFLHPPEIRDVDVSAYTGAAAQLIAITTIDDVQVASVTVRITDAAGARVEEGAAAPSAGDPQRWVYLTTAASAAPLTVLVEVADLAGQLAQRSEPV